MIRFLPIINGNAVEYACALGKNWDPSQTSRINLMPTLNNEHVLCLEKEGTIPRVPGCHQKEDDSHSSYDRGGMDVRNFDISFHALVVGFQISDPPLAENAGSRSHSIEDCHRPCLSGCPLANVCRRRFLNLESPASHAPITHVHIIAVTA